MEDDLVFCRQLVRCCNVMKTGNYGKSPLLRFQARNNRIGNQPLRVRELYGVEGGIF